MSSLQGSGAVRSVLSSHQPSPQHCELVNFFLFFGGGGGEREEGGGGEGAGGQGGRTEAEDLV